MNLRCMLTLAVTAFASASAVTSAQAQTANTYGYQCYSTLDGIQHCSCQNFTDADSGYAWLFTQLAALQQNTGGPVMVGHSDVVVQTQAANCDH